MYLAVQGPISKVYEEEFKTKMDEHGLIYEHRLIDTLLLAIKWDGGFVWGKNYDGDVQSDIVAQGFGSLELMAQLLFLQMENI